jgi:hypothetical protein
MERQQSKVQNGHYWKNPENEHDIRRVIEHVTNIKGKSALLNSKAESRVSNQSATRQVTYGMPCLK